MGVPGAGLLPIIVTLHIPVAIDFEIVWHVIVRYAIIFS